MDPAELRALYNQATALVEKILMTAEAMDALLAKGEEQRVERSEHKPIEVREVRLKDSHSIHGLVQGVGKVYEVRITLAPRRGYHCSCPDSQRRGRRVGPCKHTLALARERRDQLQPDLDRMAGGLVNCLF